jgi:hypothetical protein
MPEQLLKPVDLIVAEVRAEKRYSTRAVMNMFEASLEQEASLRQRAADLPHIAEAEYRYSGDLLALAALVRSIEFTQKNLARTQRRLKELAATLERQLTLRMLEGHDLSPREAAWLKLALRLTHRG